MVIFHYDKANLGSVQCNACAKMKATVTGILKTVGRRMI